MLRRQFSRVVPLGARGISAFSFGHPTMDKEFLETTHYALRQAPFEAEVKTLKLPNGVRVVSHHRGGAQASVGLYVEAGAKQDPATMPGLSYVMRWALPCSNMESSLFQMDRTLRAVGAAQEHVEVDKRLIGWKVEAPGDAWIAPATNLFTSMAVPRFPEYDVERFRDTMDNILQESRWQTPRQYVVDRVEEVAFFREPLGNLRFVPSELNDDISHKALLDHWAGMCLPARIILAGVNVDVEHLAAAYENAPFSHTEAAPHHKAAAKPLLDDSHEATQYTGGAERHEPESRAKEMGVHPDMAEECIAALAYRTAGRDTSAKAFATSLVLKELLDVASQDAVRTERHAVHMGLRSFYRPFATTGLIGVTVREAPGDIKDAVLAGAELVKKLPITAATVGVAAQRAKVSFFNSSLELNRDYLDFLAISLSRSGLGFTHAADITDAISAVKVGDVQKAHAALLAERPCLYATGSTYKLPSLRQMGL